MNEKKTDSEITHSMTHYLLTIHNLREENKRSRAIDLATEMGLARSSVTIALRKLKEKGLVDEDQDSNLILTKMAHGEVHDILSNRTLVYYFFKDFLGASEKASDRDSCLIEHLLSQEIQEKLFSFMKDYVQTRGCSTKLKKSETSLCLCSFKSLNDFKKAQVGDSKLPAQKCGE